MLATLIAHVVRADATRMTVSRFSLSSEVVLLLPFTTGSYAKRSIVRFTVPTRTVANRQTPKNAGGSLR